MQLRRWSSGARSLDGIYMLLSPAQLCVPVQQMTTSSGLSEIVSGHGNKTASKPATQTTEENDQGGVGILGQIARSRPVPASPTQATNTQTVGASPQQAELIQQAPRLNGSRQGLNGSVPVPFLSPALEWQEMNGVKGKYDNRWSQLLNKPPVNGQNGHLPKPASSRVSENVHRAPKPHRVQQKTITISDDITTKLLAHKLDVSISQVENILTSLGETPESTEDQLSLDAAELTASEFGFIVRKTKSTAAVKGGRTILRPPVVTVMGHVDHGKTTLLDALRHSSVAASEAGGITQHIGAFEVCLEDTGETLTFLDTPGHAAFSAMRARGARVTDLVVLVVAADDGVMPQTKESLKLIREAGCQFVVAVTKCDLPQADVEAVKRGLGTECVELEEFGGSVQLVEVAAPTGKGLNELQEALSLQAANLDLNARPDVPATGVVVEANKSKGLGTVATVIITGGTLKTGQPAVVGHHWGRIRQMKTPSGELVTEVTPGRPVELCGLRSVPQPGDELMVVCDEDRAKRVSAARLQRHETTQLSERSSSATKGELKMVPFLIKADTQGTGEAVVKAMHGLSSPVIAPEVISCCVGNVTEADVMFAEATDAQILAFNTKPLGQDVLTLAKLHEISIQQHTVIYHLLDQVGNVLLNAASLCEDEEIIGEALVQQTFNIRGKRSRATTRVAGCIVKSGSIQKSNTLFRLLRDDKILFEGPCASLRREKLDVNQVGSGMECGIMLQSFQDAEKGDVIRVIVKKQRQPKTEAVVGGGLRVVEFPS